MYEKTPLDDIIRYIYIYISVAFTVNITFSVLMLTLGFKPVFNPFNEEYTIQNTIRGNVIHYIVVLFFAILYKIYIIQYSVFNLGYY